MDAAMYRFFIEFRSLFLLRMMHYPHTNRKIQEKPSLGSKSYTTKNRLTVKNCLPHCTASSRLDLRCSWKKTTLENPKNQTAGDEIPILKKPPGFFATGFLVKPGRHILWNSQQRERYMWERISTEIFFCSHFQFRANSSTALTRLL